MSETMLNDKKQATIEDASGRKIVVGDLTFKERHRLFRILTVSNEAYMADCLMFASVRSIDGVPTPAPDPRRDVEPIIDMLGDAGCEAVQAWFAGRNVAPVASAVVDEAKN